MEVGYALEEGRPVLLDLLSTTKASIWMNRLLASVVGIETGEECLQVVPVHRLVQALDNFRWLRSHLWPMARSAPFFRDRWPRLTLVRAFGRYSGTTNEPSGARGILGLNAISHGCPSGSTKTPA